MRKYAGFCGSWWNSSSQRRRSRLRELRCAGLRQSYQKWATGGKASFDRTEANQEVDHAMTRDKRVALLYPGDREARAAMSPATNRFAHVAAALGQLRINAEPAVYSDNFADEVRRQLLAVDGVLVWVNPIEGDRDRTVLDAMLREVAATGVFVSAHPDVILKLGTKDVLYTTRQSGWGSDVHRYVSLDDLKRELPVRLATGGIRVLKQYRGNGGNGVWKVELADRTANALPGADAPVRVRHAKRGSIEQTMSLGAFIDQCRHYFLGQGRMIDQAYQPRLVDGMLRCYLVHDQVAGFGHQAINALYPAADGANPASAPQPGPRLYHPPDRPEFQLARTKLETEWLPAARSSLEISREQLPVLWDVDLLLGPRDDSGRDTYVLCEINVSSVSPFPESALPVLAWAMAAKLGLS
jgi:hypothetical protein